MVSPQFLCKVYQGEMEWILLMCISSQRRNRFAAESLNSPRGSVLTMIPRPVLDHRSLAAILSRHLSSFIFKTFKFVVQWMRDPIGFFVNRTGDDSRFRGQQHLLADYLFGILSVCRKLQALSCVLYLVQRLWILFFKLKAGLEKILAQAR